MNGVILPPDPHNLLMPLPLPLFLSLTFPPSVLLLMADWWCLRWHAADGNVSGGQAAVVRQEFMVQSAMSLTLNRVPCNFCMKSPRGPDHPVDVPPNKSRWGLCPSAYKQETHRGRSCGRADTRVASVEDCFLKNSLIRSKFTRNCPKSSDLFNFSCSWLHLQETEVWNK